MKFKIGYLVNLEYIKKCKYLNLYFYDNKYTYSNIQTTIYSNMDDNKITN